MSESEARLRLFELLWVHPTRTPFTTTAQMVLAIEEELLPWVMGGKSPRDLWPGLLAEEPKDTTP